MTTYSADTDINGNVVLNEVIGDIDEYALNPYVKLLRENASDREIELTYERDLKAKQSALDFAIKSSSDIDADDELALLQAKRLNKQGVASAEYEIEKVKNEYEEYLKYKSSYLSFKKDVELNPSRFRFWGGLIGAVVFLVIALASRDASSGTAIFNSALVVVVLPIIGIIVGIILGSIICSVARSGAREKESARRNKID